MSSGKEYLARVTPDRHDPGALAVVALAHNEANILPAFLAHYRQICRPSFLIVDDHSTDTTFELLAGQPDVTVFRPVPGSHYRDDKSMWWGQLLDAHGDGRWCLVADIDEHFLFPRADERLLDGYIADLEAEGAQTVLCVMLDMYDDRPLAQHIFDPAAGQSLRQAFPYFDAPDHPGAGYYMIRPARPRLKATPTPPVVIHGGLQERMFRRGLSSASRVERSLANTLLRLNRPIAGPSLHRFAAEILRPIVRRPFRGALNQTKLGLIKWQRGIRFGGGPHNVDTELRVSESLCVLLHYRLTRGAEGLRYIAERGQHYAGSKHYRELIAEAALMERSPVFEGSRRYAQIADLRGLLREAPATRRAAGP